MTIIEALEGTLHHLLIEGFEGGVVFDLSRAIDRLRTKYPEVAEDKLPE
jgi:hypothetical protein